jgi:hypothetical protein
LQAGSIWGLFLYVKPETGGLFIQIKWIGLVAWGRGSEKCKKSPKVPERNIIIKYYTYDNSKFKIRRYI